ncbi:hypothetical protein BHE74_00050336 [Ensete ventricosum]|nr:hypothetical protein BHE74_00050336 [Ensete ventricosum]
MESVLLPGRTQAIKHPCSSFSSLSCRNNVRFLASVPCSTRRRPVFRNEMG